MLAETSFAKYVTAFNVMILVKAASIKCLSIRPVFFEMGLHIWNAFFWKYAEVFHATFLSRFNAELFPNYILDHLMLFWIVNSDSRITILSCCLFLLKIYMVRKYLLFLTQWIVFFVKNFRVYTINRITCHRKFQAYSFQSFRRFERVFCSGYSI